MIESLPCLFLHRVALFLPGGQSPFQNSDILVAAEEQFVGQLQVVKFTYRSAIDDDFLFLGFFGEGHQVNDIKNSQGNADRPLDVAFLIKVGRAGI